MSKKPDAMELIRTLMRALRGDCDAPELRKDLTPGQADAITGLCMKAVFRAGQIWMLRDMIESTNDSTIKKAIRPMRKSLEKDRDAALEQVRLFWNNAPLMDAELAKDPKSPWRR